MDAVNTAHNFINRGFDGVRTDVIAIVIALIIVFAFMKKWGQILIMTLLSLILHLVIQAVIPLFKGGKLLIPPVTHTDFLWQAAALFIGYFFLIAILFFVKNNLLKMTKGGGAAAAH
ncbi:MAG TPA: hypothetical protein VG407_00725 [Caulobacteraceae bacterium]|jgi:hypothetical protein|nr:hypothetical protein [Caulobacteraceae bacterium]